MENKTNKKKLVITFALLALIVVASVVTTIVVVLAAQTQNVTSTVNVSYSVSDVSATVGARYWVKDDASATTTDDGKYVVVTPTGGGTGAVQGNNLVFTPDNNGAAAGAFAFGSTDAPITLSSVSNYVVFEFTFQNNATYAEDKTMTVALTSAPTPVNMGYSYCIATAQAENPEALTYITVDNKEALVTALSSGNLASLQSSSTSTPIVIYIKAQVSDLKSAASITDNTAGFSWDITSNTAKA